MITRLILLPWAIQTRILPFLDFINLDSIFKSGQVTEKYLKGDIQKPPAKD